MSESYFNTLDAMARGAPWSEESAMAAGFANLSAARTRALAFASVLDEHEWEELDSIFEQAVAETVEAWGKADFRGRGAASGYVYFQRHPDNRVERLAIWKRPNCVAFIGLELGDATRYRCVVCGVRSAEELNVKCNPWD